MRRPALDSRPASTLSQFRSGRRETRRRHGSAGTNVRRLKDRRDFGATLSRSSTGPWHACERGVGVAQTDPWGVQSLTSPPDDSPNRRLEIVPPEGQYVRFNGCRRLPASPFLQHFRRRRRVQVPLLALDIPRLFSARGSTSAAPVHVRQGLNLLPPPAGHCCSPSAAATKAFWITRGRRRRFGWSRSTERERIPRQIVETLARCADEIHPLFAVPSRCRNDTVVDAVGTE